MTQCNSLCTAELFRLPPRTVSGNQAISGDQPLERQEVFGTYVTAVYSAMTREINAKGKEARFVKKDRGLFALAARK